jgi:hypothetical protein
MAAIDKSDPVAADTVRWTFPTGSVTVNQDGSISIPSGYVLVNAEKVMDAFDEAIEAREGKRGAIRPRWAVEMVRTAILAAIQEQTDE